MDGLGTSFRCETNKELKAIYFEHLNDLDLLAIDFAAKEIIKNEERFPVVAVIRKYAKNYAPPRPKGNLATTALPEFTEAQHDESSRKLEELLATFDTWGTA